MTLTLMPISMQRLARSGPTYQTTVAAVRISLQYSSLVFCLTVTACSDGGDRASASPTARPPATSDSGMAMTPGMSAQLDSTTTGASDAAALPADVVLTAAQIQHGGIRWEAATIGIAAAVATVPGRLTPNGDRTARLGAPAAGRVVAVLVSPGERVSSDQVLVTIASPQAGMVQAEVAKAQAEVNSRRAQTLYAKTARDRATRLLALKAIPQQDYERAIADDELARAAFSQSEAELTRASSAAEQLGAVTSASGVIALRTPLAGVVLARTAEPGTVVEAGTPLVVVVDPRSLWLQVSAPESQTALFRRGGMLQFAVAAYPGKLFAARVDAIGAGLDPDTRTLQVRGVVNNGDGRLKPEMLATVSLESVHRLPAITIPDSAVQSLTGKSVVFLAHPDGKGGARLSWREVVVASRADGRVTVTRGVLPGERVVTAGAFTVKAALQKGATAKMEM